MRRQYTISELAKIAGVPTTTLRYYERAELLVPAGRSEGNYRLYSDTSLQRLRFIRAAQAIGFTLDDVKSLLGSTASCYEVQGLIQERLAEVEGRLKNLRTVQGVLNTALKRCRASEQEDSCHVIDSLRHAADGTSQRRF